MESSSGIIAMAVQESNNEEDDDANNLDTTLSMIEEDGITTTSGSSSNSNIHDNTAIIWGMPLQSLLLLNLVAIIWGTQHAVIKSVIDDTTPAKLSLLFVDDGGSGSTTSIITRAVASTLPVLRPFMTAATTTAAAVATAVVGENNAAAAGGMLESGITIGSGGGGSSSTAAYFTLARFGLATILSSPYTPGVRQIADNVRERMFGGGGGSTGDLRKTRYIQRQQQQQQQQPPDSLSTTATTESISSDSSNCSSSSSSITTAWRYGFELGIYMFLGYAFQAIGLETTTASRSGFLLYLNVKLVPFFARVLYGKSISARSWLSALVAFIGTSLLALDNNNGGVGSGGSGISSTVVSTITVGDLWSIAAAATSAIFILRMESASGEVEKSSELNAATLWTVTLLSVLWTMSISIIHDVSNTDGSTAAAAAMVMADDGSATTITAFFTIFIQSIQQIYHETVFTITQHFIPLLYLSGITTALANYIQSKAQQNISAERASIIYALDPVYGAIFANLLLGETLGKVGLVGVLLIVLAAVTNAMVDLGKQ
jgi:drug/metabolite transporter (DMT)-like permease